MLDVCLLGTSGMLPLPGRWLTSLMTRYNGSSLLIDCGEGTQIAIKEKGWSYNPIDVICFTHYHADHISGLPGLLLTIGNSDRKEPLTLVGPKGLNRVVSALRVIAPELPFEIKTIELTGQQEHLSVKGYEIDAFRVNHAVTCYGYSKGKCLAKQSISSRIIEKSVLQSISEVLADSNLSFRLVKQESKEEINRESLILDQLSRIAGKERRIRDAYRDGIDTLEEYKENKAILVKEQETLEAELEQRPHVVEPAHHRPECPERRF